MARRIGPLVLLLLAGCLGAEKTQLVPDRPFSAAPPTPPTQATYAPASTAAAARVDALGRSLLAANPQLSIRPLFCTIGAPQAEVFHRGTGQIFISEGLVQRCTTDAQLAALLCLEMGKLIAEREALADPRTRLINEDPPPDVRIGNDTGFVGQPDLTRQAELAKYNPPRRRAAPVPPPDPEALARIYFQKAGYPAAELDAATPLLKVAAGSTTLERQLSPSGAGVKVQ